MRVLMLATTAAMIEQFNKNNILILKSMGYEVHVAGNFKDGNPISDERLEEFKLWIDENDGKWFHIPASRQPLDLNGNGIALRRVLELIHNYHYDFIHCHTPIGSVIGRIAAHKTHTKIIYTAHGFHFYTGAPLKNWVLYYPVEKFLSRWTDILITINKEDYKRAVKFRAEYVKYVPGVGIDVERFSSVEVDISAKIVELGLSPNKRIILSVGEVNKNKNHEVVIRAISKIKDLDVQYVIAGEGPQKEYLYRLADNYGVELHLVGFRNDIDEIYKMADVYVLPSIREGLNVSLMEAMASHVPCIASKIRGNVDLIKNGRYLVRSNDQEGFAKAIMYALTKQVEDDVNRNYQIIKKLDRKKIEGIMRGLYSMINNQESIS